MRKISLFIAAVAIAISCIAKSDNGLFWRVTAPGAERHSYVLGSYHLAPRSFVDSIPQLNAAIESVDAVYGELSNDVLTSPQTMGIMMEYAKAPSDSTLTKLLSERDLARVDSLMKVYTGMDGATMMTNAFKPAFTSLTLTMLQTATAFPDIKAGEAFDSVVMEMGINAGKETRSLETIEEQLSILFGAPLTRQAEELMEMVDNNDTLIEESRRLISAYLSQDLDALTEIATDPAAGSDAESLDQLIYSRNRAWAEELSEVMAHQPVMVVVGAGHLGGEQGLLELLRQKGFEVVSVSR